MIFKFNRRARRFATDDRMPRLTAASVAPSPTSAIEKAKREAARRAVDDYVKDGMAIGVGSGSTIVYGIQRLAERVQNEGLKVTCVPTSFQSRNVSDDALQPPAQKCATYMRLRLYPVCLQLIIDTGMALSDLSQHPELDVAIDGADEVDSQLNCIKGGGACHTQEKLVAVAAKKFVVIADDRKQSKQLLTVWRKGIPVEVLPLAYVPVSRTLEAMGGAPQLRMAVAKAGPVVTDNGCFVLDVDFGAGSGLQGDPAALHAKIKLIPGVVETGIFAGMAVRAYFGTGAGDVVVWEPATRQ